MPDNTEDMVRLAYLLILLMALLGFSLFGGPRAVMAAAGRLIAEESLAAPDPIGQAATRSLSLVLRSLRSRLTATQPTLPWRR